MEQRINEVRTLSISVASNALYYDIVANAEKLVDVFVVVAVIVGSKDLNVNIQQSHILCMYWA